MSIVVHKKATGLPDTTGPSPEIWADCPAVPFLKDPSLGYHFLETFIDKVIVVDTSITGWVFGGTNPDIDWGTGSHDVLLETSGADNDSHFICQRPVVTPGLNNNKKFWLEGRVKFPVADSGSFFGLMEAAGCTAEAIADNCATIIDEDYIGFRIVAGDTDGLDVEVNQGGGTGPTVVKDVAHTVVADTYVNLGITFDGKDTFTYYVNGVSVGTSTADSLDNNVMAHALAVLFAGKSGTAAAGAWGVDWIRYAFEF